ncbi:unnamed protein product [Caenorhabditis auriculariae]|uniref:RING-type domain-containing protein n=1 Tax=Caenorhabditis auriculariae TaxID=2777116 RepID=A0A8S1HYR1_9PELO|nr:unnamed protein product [Caenorhabditis auriculariae]
MTAFMHCQSCFCFPSSQTKFGVTNCGHVFCSDCAKNISQTQGVCKECKKEKVEFKAVNSSLPESIKFVFTPLTETLGRFSKTITTSLRFQQGHRSRLFKHLLHREEQFGRLKSAYIEEQKKKEQYKNGCLEMQKQYRRKCEQFDALKAHCAKQQAQKIQKNTIENDPYKTPAVPVKKTVNLEAQQAMKRSKNEDPENEEEASANSDCMMQEHKRPPLTSSHKLVREPSKFHLLIAITGSIATIKLSEIIHKLYSSCSEDKLLIKVIATQNALKLWETQDIDLDEMIYEDRDEWSMWRQRKDPVLHIELRKWADALLIAPLDANSMAKIANGICDNLVTSVVRAWDLQKPCYYAPAMNTFMWDSPLTVGHRNTLRNVLLFKEIAPISKELICGDSGQGAMADPATIVALVSALVRDRLAVRTQII